MAGLRRSPGSDPASVELHHLELSADDDRTGAPARIEYRVVRSARRRRTIEVSVQAGAVTVRAPLRTSRAEIEQVVRHRARWILRRSTEAPTHQPLETGAMIPYLGEPLVLTIEPTATPRPSARLGLFGLHVAVPTRDDGDRRPDAIRDALATWLRERAVEVIPSRVERWAEHTGWKPARVLVRNQRRRWGSCAADGTLRFNWRLVMLDGALLDYVVVHELAHLRHPHHGPDFWRAVEQVLPEHRALRRRLREEGRRLPL